MADGVAKTDQDNSCPACGRYQNPGTVAEIKSATKDIRKVSSPIAGLRFPRLRHHAITELAESRRATQTIMAIAGQVSQKMPRHYSHVRWTLNARPLEALVSEGTEGCHDTNNVTNQKAAVVRKIGSH